MFVERECTRVEMFFNSDVEESDCTAKYKNYGILNK